MLEPDAPPVNPVADCRSAPVGEASGPHDHTQARHTQDTNHAPDVLSGGEAVPLAQALENMRTLMSRGSMIDDSLRRIHSLETNAALPSAGEADDIRQAYIDLRWKLAQNVTSAQSVADDFGEYVIDFVLNDEYSSEEKLEELTLWMEMMRRRDTREYAQQQRRQFELLAMQVREHANRVEKEIPVKRKENDERLKELEASRKTVSLKIHELLSGKVSSIVKQLTTAAAANIGKFVTTLTTAASPNVAFATMLGAVTGDEPYTKQYNDELQTVEAQRKELQDQIDEIDQQVLALMDVSPNLDDAAPVPSQVRSAANEIDTFAAGLSSVPDVFILVEHAFHASEELLKSTISYNDPVSRADLQRYKSLLSEQCKILEVCGRASL